MKKLILNLNDGLHQGLATPLTFFWVPKCMIISLIVILIFLKILNLHICIFPKLNAVVDLR